MAGCIAEDDLLELVQGGHALGDAPAIERHLADCAACSAVLSTLLSVAPAPEHYPGSLAGRNLGPYRLDVLIGAGAMGEVYRAWDGRLSRPVAIKVLSARVVAVASPTQTQERARRLEAEARAAAAISHPNVVTTYDVGNSDGVAFIVSELIEGESLRSVIDRGAVSLPVALDLGLQLARGLAAAHAQGVIHRDLKPNNLLVAGGTLKILDFGLAKLSGELGRDLDDTAPGTVLGTSGYLSPEQARGEPAEPQSDLFAVGAILYELVTGERAFEGATYAERLSSVLRDAPRRLDVAHLGALAPVVARCLEKDARRRFQSAQDLAWVLEGLAERSTDRAAQPAPTDQATPTDQPFLAAPTAPSVSRRTLLAATAAAAVGGALLGRWLGRAHRSSGASAAVSQQLTYRLGRIGNGRFTRDGGSVIYSAAWDGGPLSIYTTRLGGGGTRALDLPSADVLAVSARGELALCVGRRYVDGFHASGQLAIAPLEGGVPRVLADDIQQADFVPDAGSVQPGESSTLAVVRRAGQIFRLELPLGSPLLEGGWLSYPRVSPDGARVAVLRHPSPQDDRGEVVIVERATGEQRTLSGGWSSVSGLAWSPTGQALWFAATRQGGNNALHAVTLDGRESSVAQTTGRLRLHDLASDGRAMVSLDNWRLCMRVHPPGATGEIDGSLSDLSMVSDISADGRTLVVGEFGEAELASGAYLRPSDGGPSLRLGDGFPMSLANDGRRVLALPANGSRQLLSYATSGGVAGEIAIAPIDEILWARWLGDQHAVVSGSAKARPPRLWLVATSDGGAAPRPITDEGSAGQAHVSRDASRIAFVDGSGRLVVTPVDAGGAGAPGVVPGTYRGELVCGWCADDTAVFIRSQNLPLQIRRVDLASGRSTPHAEITPPRLGLKGLDALAISAAGDAYAYSYGEELSRLYAIRVHAAT